MAAIMHEMMTIGVILASNSVPPLPVGPANPPAGMTVFVCALYFKCSQIQYVSEKRRRIMCVLMREEFIALYREWESTRYEMDDAGRHRPDLSTWMLRS